MRGGKQYTHSSPTLEDIFLQNWLDCPGAPSLQKEVGLARICDSYYGKMRHDYVLFGARKFIIEINGGTYQRGRTGHTTGSGIARDYVKQILAASADYTLLELDTKMAKDKDLIPILVDIVNGVKISDMDADYVASFA